MNAVAAAWDWQMIGFGVAQLVALVGAYWGLRRDNDKTRSDLAAENSKTRSDLALALLSERTDRLTTEAAVKADLLALITRIDNSVQDLTHRINTLESGQDSWTKELRERTHGLSNDMNALVLKVALMERTSQLRTGEGHDS